MSFKYAISVVCDDILYDINHIIEQLHNKPDGLLFEDAEPAEVCEGYVFTPVCQSFCSQGGWWLGPGPWEVGESGWGCLGPGPRGRLGGLARGMSRPRPRGRLGDLAGGCPGLHPGGGVQAQAWGCVSQHALRQTPPQQTATAAGNTHSTGMHSCFHYVCKFFEVDLTNIFFYDRGKCDIRNQPILCNSPSEK